MAMGNFSEVLDRLASTIDEERERRLFDKEFAELLGMTPAQFSNHKRRNTIPCEYIGDFCAKNHISLSWVLYGQPTELLDSGAENFFRVKAINVRSSAGGGAVNEEEMEITYLNIDPAIGDALDIRGKDSIEAIRAIGESMEPTVSDGAIILLDRKKTEIHNGGIFVFNSHNGVLVKRVEIDLHGQVVLISDNTSYPPRAYPREELEVIGKVVGLLEKV